MGGWAGDAPEVSAHLAGCAECRSHAQKLRALTRMLAPEATLSADFDRRFFAKLAAERPPRWFAASRARWWAAPLLAGACAALLLFFWVGHTGLSDEQRFIAENQEMLAQLDLLKSLDAANLDDADFAVVQALPTLRAE
jgi:anti-sigma factor RsiW